MCGQHSEGYSYVRHSLFITSWHTLASALENAQCIFSTSGQRMLWTSGVTDRHLSSNTHNHPLHKGSLHPKFTVNQIIEYYILKNSTEGMTMQMQKGSSDYGLFVIAIATVLIATTTPKCVARFRKTCVVIQWNWSKPGHSCKQLQYMYLTVIVMRIPQTQEEFRGALQKARQDIWTITENRWSFIHTILTMYLKECVPV